MLRPRTLIAILELPAVVFLVAACGVSGPSSNKTDPFSGTVPVGGAISHGFSSGGSGEFTVKLTSVTPDTNAILSIGFGQLSGSTCIPFAGYVAPARANNPPTALSGPIDKGNYCIRVADAGFLTQPANYSLTVSHP